MGVSMQFFAADPFFETIHDNEWNAVSAYRATSRITSRAISKPRSSWPRRLDKKMVASRDTLAMPILYNGRHALELSLKFAINRLHKIGVIANKHVANHDILSHWELLRDARIGNSALRQLVLDLQPYVVSLANIDDDGQELRYATTRDGKKSLDNLAVVNLVHIRKSLEAMSGILTRLRYRVIDLEGERLTGSHTKGCSREDLLAIAAILGDHSTWTDDSFNNKKAVVRERFQLSSNKLSDAINQIKGSRALATLVGIETPLTYLTDKKAVFALEQWVKANPERAYNPDDLGTDYFNRNFDLLEADRRVTRELIDVIIANLTEEEISDLEVLFYIGRGGEFGEHYSAMLAESGDEAPAGDLALGRYAPHND